eukprot:GHRR01016999.1.p1 GENE.GHRR01016999.1~~GHRR01016999.1.p1  ORF type:complete len:232 (+),score=58.23 GHRR01016999.1:1130-1825(+)
MLKHKSWHVMAKHSATAAARNICTQPLTGCACFYCTQVGQSHFFRLPGGKLKPDEDEVSGLKRKLDIYLAPESEMLKSPWDIGECVGSWVRPNFDTVFYPYTPPHITKPKEVKKLYVVQLPENTYFGVPKSYNLVAVPLFELYDNFTRYGPVIASIPIMLSRLRLNCVAPPPTGTTDLDLAALAGANQQQQQQQGALQLVKVDSSQAAAGQFGEEYEGIAGDHSRRASVVM